MTKQYTNCSNVCQVHKVGMKKKIPQLMLQYAFKLIFYQQFKRLTFSVYSLVLIYVSMISLKVNLATTVPCEMGNNLNKPFKLTFYKAHHC